MDEIEEAGNRLKLGFSRTVQPNSFWKFISVVSNFKNNARERFLFVKKLGVCHLQVFSLLK